LGGGSIEGGARRGGVSRAGKLTMPKGSGPPARVGRTGAPDARPHVASQVTPRMPQAPKAMAIGPRASHISRIKSVATRRDIMLASEYVGRIRAGQGFGSAPGPGPPPPRPDAISHPEPRVSWHRMRCQRPAHQALGADRRTPPATLETGIPEGYLCGVVAHERGHAVGLPHTDDVGSIMCCTRDTRPCASATSTALRAPASPGAPPALLGVLTGRRSTDPDDPVAAG
jgi:hypothetical protein